MIEGAWTGRLELRVTEKLARRAAAATFAMEPHEVGEAEVRDALGELANIAGDNVKALIPGPCTMSFPQVEADRRVRPGDTDTCLVDQAYEDQHVQRARSISRPA